MDFGAVKTCQGGIGVAGGKRHLRVWGLHIPTICCTRVFPAGLVFPREKMSYKSE